jgi:hypothetical protein
VVERGYSPEIAYLECVHQVKFLADLLHDRGIAGFRRAISGTALYGDLTRGPRVVGEPARGAMSAILDEIRSGAFAREWTAEVSGWAAAARCRGPKSRRTPDRGGADTGARDADESGGIGRHGFQGRSGQKLIDRPFRNLLACIEFCRFESATRRAR